MKNGYPNKNAQLKELQKSVKILGEYRKSERIIWCRKFGIIKK